MTTTFFGLLPDGTEITETTIKSDQLTAQILSWGATVRDLRLADHKPALVLGLNSIDDYLAGSAHMLSLIHI